jgi:predicted metal-binding protein
MVRKIVENVPYTVLQKDLKKYERMAIEHGATDAKIITTDMVVIDERVRAKCIYPKCEWYGTNAHCPPHAPELEQMRKLVNSFKHAIFLRMRVPTELLAAKRTTKQLEQYKILRKKALETIGKIESTAFYDGYYLALGFGCGTCKLIFCPNGDCKVLKGESCMAPHRARASMEAVGMDVYKLATKVGWDIYPIGKAPSDAPYGTIAGIVFIY